MVQHIAPARFTTRSPVRPFASLGRMLTPKLERRARALNGLPRRRSGPLWKRVLTSGYTWGLLAIAILSLLALVDMYAMMHRDIELPDGRIAYGIPREIFVQAAKWAWPTALVWSALFIWLDRFRTLNISLYVMAFLWGGCLSTWFSMHVNSWAGERMGVTGQDPDTGARAAIFSAPFVEEISKVTILFGLALFIRYRLVSSLQLIPLAGLSAIGFAFVENIVYYARAYNYATQVPGIEDPIGEVMQLVMLRGVYTSFGHPLFTSMTAFGLVVGLRHRSKLVRVCAPLAGFCFSALGHMIFNGIASTVPLEQSKIYWFMALGVVLMILIMLIGHLITEMRRIRARLTDYVRTGWLLPDDPKTYSGPFTRPRLVFISLFQPSRVPATWRMIGTMTELAYLRDAMVRGLVDEAGNDRARDLVDAINADRAVAVTRASEPIVLPPLPKFLRRHRTPQLAPVPVRTHR